MKKILASVLVAVMLTLSLTGCVTSTSYEKFHAKALEVSENSPQYTTVKVSGRYFIGNDIEMIDSTYDVTNGYANIDTKTALILDVNLKYELETRIYISNIIGYKAWAIGKDMVSYKMGGSGFVSEWSMTVGANKQSSKYEFDKYGYCVYHKESVGENYAELTLTWS